MVSSSMLLSCRSTHPSTHFTPTTNLLDAPPRPVALAHPPFRLLHALLPLAGQPVCGGAVLQVCPGAAAVLCCQRSAAARSAPRPGGQPAPQLPAAPLGLGCGRAPGAHTAAGLAGRAGVSRAARRCRPVGEAACSHSAGWRLPCPACATTRGSSDPLGRCGTCRGCPAGGRACCSWWSTQHSATSSCCACWATPRCWPATEQVGAGLLGHASVQPGGHLGIECVHSRPIMSCTGCSPPSAGPALCLDTAPWPTAVDTQALALSCRAQV